MPHKLIASLRRDLAELQKAGAIGEATIQQFDAFAIPGLGSRAQRAAIRRKERPSKADGGDSTAPAD